MRNLGVSPLGLCVVGALTTSACLNAWGADASHGPRRYDTPHATHAGAGATSAPRSRTRSFYVTAAGDDTASGQSPDAAWRSLDRVNEQVFQPGDRLWLEAGTRFEGTLRLQIEGGGQARSPVRLSSFHAGQRADTDAGAGAEADAGTEDERATIAAGTGDGIVISDLSGVLVEQLRIVGGWRADLQSGNEGEGIRVVGTRSRQGSAYVRLRDLDVSGFKLAGVGLHARPADDSKNSGYRDVELATSVIHDNGAVGVVSDGPYVYDRPGYSHAQVRVRNVVAHHNRGLLGAGEHTGSGIVLSDVDDATIERCVAHDNGDLNDHEGGGGFGIWAWDSTRVVIQYNESYDNRTRTEDGGGFDLDGGTTRSVLRYNYSHGNQGAGFGAFQFSYARASGDNRIYGNITQNDHPGIAVWDGNGDLGRVEILQNVSYGEAPALRTLSRVRSLELINNVFVGVGPVLADVFDGSGLTLQGDVYWSGDQPFVFAWGSGTAGGLRFESFETFRSATQQESFDGAATGSYGDPQLVAAGQAPTLNDADALDTLTMYQLRPESPVIDRGVDPATFDVEPVHADFFGDRMPSGAGYDPGVYERAARR